MVYSRKKVIRNPYEPAKKRQKAEDAAEKGKSFSAPKISLEKNQPPSLVDVANKAASVLRSARRDDDGSERTTCGSSTTYWQRLPSQSFSFESAEILTVQECVTHAAIYRNKAIRTTGLFVQRDLSEKGQVLLKLRHPIQPKPFKSIVPGNQRPRVNTIRSTMSSKQGLLDRKRTRPGVGGKLFSKLSPAVQQSRSLHDDISGELLLVVEVDPGLPGLGGLVVGSSMVMVIGTLQEDRTVLARIVRILEHFDAARHDACLNARRRMIYKKHLQHQGQPTMSLQKEEQTPIVHGCGPPPYDSLV